MAASSHFVRAVDDSGNRSASTPATTAVATEPADATLIGSGSSWSYFYSAIDPAPGWQAPDYDASSWQTGLAPLGWGQAILGTTLTAAAPKPLTSYFRRSFTIADPSEIGAIEVTTRADDGIVLYLNGVEITRVNMPSGTVTSGTYAISAISATNALAHPVVVQIPGSSLLAGTNVMTAEVHSNYRSTPSASFELSAVVK